MSETTDLRSAKAWLTFIAVETFDPAWKRLGLNDDDLRKLQILICAWPERGPVISGTGGVRKMRFAPESWGVGARGAIRVYYALFPGHGLAALLTAHSKAEREAIPDSDKRRLKALIGVLHKDLERRATKRKGKP